MSKIKLLTIAVIGLLLINIAVVVFLFTKKTPHPPEGRPPMGTERMPKDGEGPKRIIIGRLQFDKDQVEAYEELIAEHQSAVRSVQDSIRLLKNELYQLLTAESFAGKDSLVSQINALQKQMELVHFDHFAALKKLCKPDQLNRFNKLTDELAHFFAPGRNGPPPPKD